MLALGRVVCQKIRRCKIQDLTPGDAAALRTPGQGHAHMAGTAEQPVILEAALPAAVCHRDDVIGFPTRTRGSPRLARRPVRGGRFRTRPLAMRFDDIEAAQSARPLVALLHLLAHIPGTAADLPFVHTGVAAEGPPRTNDSSLTPAANRIPGFVPLRNAPLIGSHNARATSAHAQGIGTSGCQIYPFAPAFIRRSMSSGLTSSTCVEIHQVTPAGSTTPALRSP